jgi:hypothetical protein
MQTQHTTKSVAFLYTKMNRLLTKEVYDLYNENYNTLKKLKTLQDGKIYHVYGLTELIF